MTQWQLWSSQIDGIVRYDLRRYWHGRRWMGVYLMVLAPVILLTLRWSFAPARNLDRAIETLQFIYAGFFQTFVLRLAIFFSCMTIFSQMVRGEILEKTLHYYLLVPVRREVLALGKYVAGLVATVSLFIFCVTATYLLLFLPSHSAAAFFSNGQGIPHLARYLVVSMLACLGYGAVFLLVGLYFKNPIVPALGIALWESFNFVLPSVLQKISVIHYLNELCPVPIPRSPFAVVTGPTSPFISVPGLLMVTCVVLFVVGFKIRRTEITYSAD
jgi:ABC-type transport system involved in multi-copper enzyme maturation permease subunit